jgi:hypothetical protein
MFSILFALLLLATNTIECFPGKKKGKSSRKGGGKTTSFTPSTIPIPSLSGMSLMGHTISQSLGSAPDNNKKTGLKCSVCEDAEIYSGPAFLKCLECEAVPYCSEKCRKLHLPVQKSWLAMKLKQEETRLKSIVETRIYLTSLKGGKGKITIIFPTWFFPSFTQLIENDWRAMLPT